MSLHPEQTEKPPFGFASVRTLRSGNDFTDPVPTSPDAAWAAAVAAQQVEGTEDTVSVVSGDGSSFNPVGGGGTPNEVNLTVQSGVSGIGAPSEAEAPFSYFASAYSGTLDVYFHTGTCYFKCWFRKRVTTYHFTGMAPMTSNVDDDTDVFEWEPPDDGSALCLPDEFVPVPEAHDDGSELTEGEWRDVVQTWNSIPTKTFDPVRPADPSTPPAASESYGATVFFSIRKYSFIKGYEPPDDGSANGFPK